MQEADFTDALEKIVLGAERKVMMSEEDKRRTAYHEGGHAIVGMLTEGADPVRKISIIPRGLALGVTFSAPDADRFNYSEQELNAKIKVALGGRSAEEIVFGDLTTGAESDIQQLTQIARHMVGRWGMSTTIGTVTVIPSDGQGPLLPGAAGVSEETQRLIDEEVRRIVASRARGGPRAADGEPGQARLARAGAARARDARPARRVRRGGPRRRGRARLMLAAALAALALVAAKPAAAQHPIASPIWSADGTKIAWVESNGGRHDVWAANADGTKPHLLASGIDALYQLAWLPSGDFLYDVNYHLFRVGHDGQPRPIATGVTFSLDTKGDKVAYQTAESCPTCHGPVEVLSLATGRTWTIAPTGQNLFPALSPDGRSVAFTRFLGSGGGRYVKPGGIWIAAAAGGAPVQRTKAGLCPQWSPDGRRLTYADSAGLHLIARNGGAGTLLLRENGLPACSTQWSPDGRRIASVTSHGRLVVIDPATRASRTIGPKHSVDLAWAPDGSRLLVSGGAGAQLCSSLWSIRPDGSGLRKLRSC